MEASNAIKETPLKEIINLNNFELNKDKIKYNFLLQNINQEKIKISCTNIIDYKFNKYELYLNINDFIMINKYFRMFDTLKEIGEELISIINDKKIEINNITNESLELKLDLMTRNNNIIYLKLNKIKINEKDKINYIYEEIINLNKRDKIKDKKIKDLEIKIEKIEKQNLEFKKELNELKNKLEKVFINSEKNLNDTQINPNNETESELNFSIKKLNNTRNNIIIDDYLDNDWKEIKNVLDIIFSEKNLKENEIKIDDLNKLKNVTLKYYQNNNNKLPLDQFDIYFRDILSKLTQEETLKYLINKKVKIIDLFSEIGDK